MNPIVRMMTQYGLPLLCICVLVLAVSISGCTSSTTSNPSPSAGSVATATPIATPTVVTGTASNSKISVAAVNQGVYVSNNPLIQPAAGDQYVQIYATVTNVNDPGAMIGDQDFFTLFDSSHVGYQPTLASFANGGMQSISNSNPGQITAGTLIFEIPQGANPVTIIYNDFTNDLTITLGTVTPSVTPTPTPTPVPTPPPQTYEVQISGSVYNNTGYFFASVTNQAGVPQALNWQINWWLNGQLAGGTWTPSGGITVPLTPGVQYTVTATYLTPAQWPNVGQTLATSAPFYVTG